jgi:hypothetical protein
MDNSFKRQATTTVKTYKYSEHLHFLCNFQESETKGHVETQAEVDDD